MVGELVAFISFLSLSVSVFLESVKHLIDVIFILPQRESHGEEKLKAHGHGKFSSEKKNDFFSLIKPCF